MDVNLYETKVRDGFARLFRENKKISDIYKKVQYGIATYEEAHSFSIEIGNILSEVFKENVNPDDINDTVKFVTQKMLSQNIELSSAICEGVQRNLNKAANISINPVRPNKARTNDRINGIIENLESTKSVSKLSQSSKTLTLANVDDWVKTNADFQAKAGLSPVIVRVWDGTKGSHDTKRTDWCEQVAGTYEYPVKDKRVFQRHEGCQCIVTYYPDKNAKGRITALAKGEVDTEGVLWNTGLTVDDALRKIKLNITKTAASLEKTPVDALMDRYEEYRKKFLRNAVEITDETRESLKSVFQFDLSNIRSEFRGTITDTLSKLGNDFYSPLSRVETFEMAETLGNNAFAITRHMWDYGTATLKLNPLKISKKGLKRLRELAKDGYSIKYPAGKELEYLITHEYGHTIINLLEKLPSEKRNFVGTDLTTYKNARKELHKIYADYIKELEKAQKAYDEINKPLENKMLFEGKMPTPREKAKLNYARKQLDSLKLSKYALTNEDEFIAECFADARVGSNPSKYSKEVYSVIVKYFGK